MVSYFSLNDPNRKINKLYHQPAKKCMDYKLRDVERKLKDVEFQTLHETHSRSNCPLQYLSTTVMVGSWNLCITYFCYCHSMYRKRHRICKESSLDPIVILEFFGTLKRLKEDKKQLTKRQ